MRRRTSRVVFLLILGSLALACEPEIPEAYGVYLLDGGKYHELKEGVEPRDRNQFSSKAKVLVFSKLLLSEREPSAYLELGKRYYWRATYNPHNNPSVEPSPPPHVLYIGQLDYSLKPVPGNPEMIFLEPNATLEKGGYLVRVYRELGSQQLLFGVDLGDKPDEETLPCRDLYSEPRPMEYRPCEEYDDYDQRIREGLLAEVLALNRFDDDVFKDVRDVKALVREDDELLEEVKAVYIDLVESLQAEGRWQEAIASCKKLTVIWPETFQPLYDESLAGQFKNRKY